MPLLERIESHRPAARKRSGDTLWRFMLAVFGTCVLYVQLPQFMEFQRIYSGATANAVVTRLDTSTHTRTRRNRPREYSTAHPKFHFDYLGTTYSSDRFGVFEFTFATPNDAIDAMAAIVKDGSATAYFDPKDPSRAVLNIRLRPRSLEYLLLGCILIATGVVLLCERVVSKATGSDTPLLSESTGTGHTVRLLHRDYCNAILAAAAALVVGTFIFATPIAQADVAPELIWTLLFVPAVSQIIVLVLCRMFLRGTGGGIELDGKSRELRILASGFFGSRYKFRSNYDAVIDVDSQPVVHSETANAQARDLYNPVLYLTYPHEEDQLRIDCFELPLARCEEVCNLIRERIQKTPSPMY